MNKNLSLIEPNILTIGVDASAPLPLHSDPGLPNFEGFEVDLMKSVAGRLKIPVSYKNSLWTKLLHDLVDGRVDMICTASTITKERKEIVAFSQPYLDIRLAIVTRNESSIETLADIGDRIVGVRLATTAEDFLRRYARAKSIRTLSIRTFDMNTDAYKTLQAGEMNAVIDDSPIAQSFADSTPGLKLAGTIPGTEAQYAMMFRKGNDELRIAINDALTSIGADGTYDKIYRRWFAENSAPIRAAL